MRSLVALIRIKPETALQDYERVMALAAFQRHIAQSSTTLLCPTEGRHFPIPSANTTPWQLEGVARALRDAGYDRLSCFRSTGAMTSAFKGQDLNGYLPILRAYQIAACPTAGRLSNARRAGLAACLQGANIVLLPTLKTDAAATLGGALWSALRALPPSGWLASPEALHVRLVEAFASLRERSAGIFAVMDGTTAGSGPGPYRLAPEVRNVVLASADPVALDAVAARLLGFDPLRDIGYLRLAHERGLGVGDPREIALIGDADLARERWRFSAGGARHRFGQSILERFAAHAPFALLLALAVESYHDYYRWPFEERQVFESWLRGTHWGRLFARYQRPGGPHAG